MLPTGALAPDFALSGIGPTLGTGGNAPTTTSPSRRTYTLSDYRGQTVVLVFYPADSSPVCTKELNTYTDDIAAFHDVETQVLAMSPQSVDSHEAFAVQQGGFAFPLLADEAKTVGRLYDVVGPLGFYRRSTFVVDTEGTIRYAHRAIAGITFRPTDELVEAVRRARA